MLTRGKKNSIILCRNNKKKLLVGLGYVLRNYVPLLLIITITIEKLLVSITAKTNDSYKFYEI